MAENFFRGMKPAFGFIPHETGHETAMKPGMKPGPMKPGMKPGALKPGPMKPGMKPPDSTPIPKIEKWALGPKFKLTHETGHETAMKPA